MKKSSANNYFFIIRVGVSPRILMKICVSMCFDTKWKK